MAQTTPTPITTTAQARTIAALALLHVEPGCPVVLTPRVVQLLLDAIPEEDKPDASPTP